MWAVVSRSTIALAEGSRLVDNGGTSIVAGTADVWPCLVIGEVGDDGVDELVEKGGMLLPWAALGGVKDSRAPGAHFGLWSRFVLGAIVAVPPASLTVRAGRPGLGAVARG